MTIIIFTYYLLYLPGFVDSLFDYDRSIKDYVDYIVSYIWSCNALCNPIIYYYTNNDFRKAFRVILHLKDRSENDLETNFSETSQRVVVSHINANE